MDAEGARRAKRVPRRYRRREELFVSGNVVRLLRDGAEAFPAMLQAIDGARTQVLLELYWMGGAVGEKFIQALVSAKRRGVEVAVIYDALGCFDTPASFFRPLEQADIPVVEFNPVMPWKRRFKVDGVSKRDHRKLLVVDEHTGFTGGVNLADPWLPEDDTETAWRDDAVEVRGPAAEHMAAHFHRIWRLQHELPIEPVAALDEPPLSRIGAQSVRVLGEFYDQKRLGIIHAYLAHIWHAQSRVWIRNSYFVPDLGVTRALVYAARRGVDVRVIVPGDIDVPVVRYASRATWSGLMRAGVRLYEWHGDGILHAKSALMDDDWSTVGTFNLDHRSIVANLEINVAIRDRSFGSVMEESFERDFLESRLVDADEFRGRGTLDKALEILTYQFRRFM